MTGVPHIEGRWWGSTSASVAAHAVLFALVMLIATKVSNIADPPRALNPSALVFIPERGSGNTAGGGGDTVAKPPRPAVIERTTQRAPAPTPSDAIQSPAFVPVLTPTAVETLPGAPAAIDAASAGPGKGNGPGGGGGRGTGNGPGEGPGIGDGVYEPGNGVTDPVLVREVKPNYTADALRAKIQGTVEMQAVVRADGIIDPRTIRIVRSLDPTFGLNREAIEAVKQWRFKPAMRKGEPVAVLVTLELLFTLR